MLLAAGTRLGPYEISAPLGRGGMGEVYCARDVRLGRDVAVKILPHRLANDSAARTRFEREAMAVAALSHPNIVVIFDLGEERGVRFAVMELLQGETLRERIQRSPCSRVEAAKVGAAIADGLNAAHAKGIIHRDLKPENVFLTADGQVKVLDFGLARIASAVPDGLDNLPTTAMETTPGTILGTFAYMSPEQVRGATSDAASDVFSLGSVLYEITTGRPAFSRPSPAETMAAILDHTPPRISASPELDRLVSRCLAKEARKRPSASAAASALRQLIEHPTPSRRSHAVDSIAVLPFVNTGNGEDTDYLCDGITESLINHLSDIHRLRVVPRSTAFRYRGVDIDPGSVAHELNVRVLLTGRVLQRGDTLNVQAELIDAAANSQVWGQKYSRTLSDMCAVEEQIAREIADTLRVKLNRADKTRLAHRATRDGEAYQLYLRGRYLWNRRTRDALGRAIVYFQQAIDRDPAYALAYAGLADCYGVLGTFTFAAPGETFPRAKAAARRAIEIDENLAEAHVTLAMVEMFFDGNRETAEREFRRALALNANYAVAHQWYGMHRCFVADFEHGLAELDYARQLEPLSPMINVQLGVGLCLARRSDEAAHILRNTLAFEPAFWPAHLFLAMVSMQQHDQTHAIAEAELATELSERHPIAVSALGYVLGRTGAVPRAAQLLAELSARAQTEYIDPYHFALVHLALGDETLALQRLQEAVSGQSPYALWRVVDPRLDPLRANVSFTALLPDPFGSDAVPRSRQKNS
jgi:serine/threonine protein kinase/tetratricopeptide (TPR) repeat protein